MLAQFNVKQKTLGLFLNSKPTVIDKLISRNKSSILGLTVETSEGSDSGDSGSSMGSESTNSDTDTNRQVHAKRTLQSARMAPMKKHVKKQVLGSKITPKLKTIVGPFKRKAGRPKKNPIDNSNEVPNTSKKVVTKKVSVVKRTMRGKCPEIKIDRPNKEVKLPKLKRKRALKEDDLTVASESNLSSQKNSPVLPKKAKLSVPQDQSPSNSTAEKKLSPKKLIPASTRALALLNATKTLKKFPILDRWKNAVVVRGRGRPRGSGNLRARGRGHARGRSAPYLTRSDSPIPILRNGKRRKFSDPSNLPELCLGKRKKRLFSDLITKSDDCSDEQSSIVTESEYSYCESVSTPKGDDDREIKTESNNCDSDVCDVPDNTTDTNSNVFKPNKSELKVKTESNSISDNSSPTKTMEYKLTDSDKNIVKKDDQKAHILSESFLRDSDGSFDSDATEDSSQKSSSRKKYKRRILEGVWVRRSTRTINLKEIDNDTAAIKELLNEKIAASKNENCSDTVATKNENCSDTVATKNKNCSDTVANKNENCSDTVATKNENCSDTVATKNENCSDTVANKNENCSVTVANKNENCSDTVITKNENYSDTVATKNENCSDTVANKNENCSDTVATKNENCSDTVATKNENCSDTVATKNENCSDTGKIDTESQNSGKAKSPKSEELNNLMTKPSSDTEIEPLIDFTLMLEESPIKESEGKKTPIKIKYDQRLDFSSAEITAENEEDSTTTHYNNTTKLKLDNSLESKENEDGETGELTKSTATFLGCLQKSFGKNLKETFDANNEEHVSQSFKGKLVPLEFTNDDKNVNRNKVSENETKIIKPLIEDNDNRTDEKIISKPITLLNQEKENFSKVRGDKVSVQLKTNENSTKNIAQKDILRSNVRLSTSEIESILTSEIDSPVKAQNSIQLSIGSSDAQSGELNFGIDNDSTVDRNNDIGFTEILGTSISISEFANIPLSSLDETSNPLEEVLNGEESCKSSNLFDDSEDGCPDQKILSLIDSFCKADNEPKLDIGAHSVSVENNLMELKQNASNDRDEILLIIESMVQKVIDKEDLFIRENSNNGDLINEKETRSFAASRGESKDTVVSSIDEKLEETLSTGLDSYFPFKQFDSNKLSLAENKTLEFSTSKNDDNLRTSVDSKFNMDIEDKEDDMLKRCESTEESSSTDSNSHLMDLIGDPPMESMQLSGSHEDVSQSEYLDQNTSELKDVDDFSKTNLPSSVDGESCFPERRSSDLQSDTRDKESENVPNELFVKDKMVEESPEEQANKESILNALGLQSLRAVPDNKPKRAGDNYTGTLKAVIKLNRATDKKSGGHKMIFKQGELTEEDHGAGGDRLEYRICTEPEASTEGVPLTHLGDIATFKKLQAKPSKPQFDLSSSPNIVGAQTSVQPESGLPPAESADGVVKESNLVIPEKSSSFSIHPGRLCSDVCSYCFGKFGSLDTPCHLAQLKNAERLNKILTTETHLAVDSCLCDGCFRYVDRKANCPSRKSLSRKPGQRRGPLSGTCCSVQGCTQAARHSVRRKWLVKLKKSIAKKLVIDMDKNPHLPFPLCSQHYFWVDYFTVCGICRKRLTRNHMYALGPEAEELNVILSEDGIPVKLSDKLFLCKLCRYYSSLRLKYRDPSQMTANHKLFFQGYRKKILLYHEIPVSDSEEDRKSVPEEDPKSLAEIPKPRKKKSKSKSIDGQEGKKRSGDKSSDEKQDIGVTEKSTDSQMIDYTYLETLGMNQEMAQAPTVDYSTLGAYERQECAVGFSNIASLLNPLEGGQGTVYPSTDNQTRPRVDNMKPTRIQVKFGNLNIGKLSNLNIGQDSRPGNESRCPTVNPDRPQYLPGERDLKLSAEFDFHGHPSPNVNWERCTSTIQFDSDTKRLWQELQRPYGNQSSFLRHLLILEKHWRAGSVVYSEKPDPRAVKYMTSVQNRVQAYEGGGCSSPKPNVPPPPPVIPLSVASPIVRPPPVSTPSSFPSSQPPPLMKIPQPWPPNDHPRKSTYNTNFSMPTTQIVRPVEIQRFPIVNKTSAAIGPRPRKPNFSVSLGRGLGIRSPGPITFQQLKRLQMQKAMQNESNTAQQQPEHTVQSGSLHRSTPSPSAQNSFVPLISDVRSLATNTNWNESFKNSYQQQTRHFPPILPKIPKALTVTQIVQPCASPVLLRNTSLTIEKASNPSSKPVAVLCPEKPSISVFREPTPNGNV